jgi:tetratricopeptide (TPR) repeat protein
MARKQGMTEKILIRLVNQVLDPYFLLYGFLFGFLGYQMLAFFEFKLKIPLSLYVAGVFGSSLLVAVFRWDWTGLMKELTIDEEAVRKNVEAEERYHAARLALKKERYADAVDLYEKVLAYNASNLQARFDAARAYLRKLNDRENGRRHLQVLAETAPPGHPYRAYAVEELGKLNRETVQRVEKGEV